MFHLNGDSQRALSLLALVTKSEPSYPIGWESTARVAIDIKDWPTAENAIAKLAAINGQKLTAVYLRGTMLIGTGNVEEAVSQFTDVVSADPNTPLAEHALIALVSADRSLKRLEAASHYIETLSADSSFVTTVLGECYVDLGNFDDAAKAFDKAIGGKAGRPEPFVDRARLYVRQREMDHAIEVLKTGAAAIPSDIQIPMMAAELLGSVGRYQEAETIYDDLLERNPALDAAANNLAELIADYQFGDPVAMEKARRVAERFQGATNPLLLDTLGWVYFRQGNLSQAMTMLERAVATGKVPAQVHYHYGAVLSKLDRKDLAKTQLEQAAQTSEPYAGLDEAKHLLQSL
jgi:tetratricopeptide (TPR) repeat protein